MRGKGGRYARSSRSVADDGPSTVASAPMTTDQHELEATTPEGRRVSLGVHPTLERAIAASLAFAAEVGEEYGEIRFVELDMEARGAERLPGPDLGFARARVGARERPCLDPVARALRLLRMAPAGEVRC